MRDSKRERSRLQRKSKAELVDEVLRLRADTEQPRRHPTPTAAARRTDGDGETGELNQLISALRTCDGLLPSFLTQASIGIGIDLPSGETVYANSTLSRLLGYTPDELLRLRFWQYSHPDHGERDRRLFEAMIAGECDSYAIEKAYTTKNGVTVWGRVTRSIRRDAAGRPLYAVGILNDITERKSVERAHRDAEARIRAIVEASPNGIFLKDRHRRFTLVNKAFCTFHERREDEIVGRRTDELQDAETARKVLDIDRAVLAGSPAEQSEWSRARSDGSVRHYVDTKFPVHDEAGNILGLGGITRDVTESRNVQESLRQAKEMAEIASRAKTEFLANMSHELRTPLNSIIGFSQLMNDEAFGPLANAKYREYATDMLQSGRALLELINDILDVSRVEVGELVLTERWIDIPKLLRAVARSVAERAHRSGVELRIEADHGGPPLFGDERRVRQILQNLLSNAVKFTPRGGIVRATASLNASGGIVLSVSDTGVGIPENKIDTALSVFGQVQNAFTRSHDGAGLGLPLSRKLTELHGGALTLESTPGAGTTVSVVFPPGRTGEPVANPVSAAGLAIGD